jgi:uncharacterized membrane protein (DUF106 family)
MIWLVLKHAEFSMDDYMMSRAERRIDELESEIRRIKLETDRMQWDIRRVEDTQSRASEPKPELYFLLFAGLVWLMLFVAIVAKAKSG